MGASTREELFLDCMTRLPNVLTDDEATALLYTVAAVKKWPIVFFSRDTCQMLLGRTLTDEEFQRITNTDEWKDLLDKPMHVTFAHDRIEGILEDLNIRRINNGST